MISISIKEYAKKHVKCNPDEDLNDVISRLKDAVKRKNSGATCSICGSSIWAIGSAVGGFEGCFTCITGEHDDSEDYEVF